jgi:SAM-dependent methyltransferase
MGKVAMAMVLSQVVPFGRSFDEYGQMFALSSADLSGSVLGVGDGPASFNAEATAKGYQVISVDPVYQFTGLEIRLRFDAVVDNIIGQIEATPADWVWTYHGSPASLRANRLNALETFLADYDTGLTENRYVIGALPELPFADNSFTLALCSHLLFLYSDQLNEAFHMQSIQDMLRVAPEVRIFPLLTLSLSRSPYVDRILQRCQKLGYTAEIHTVTYELQKGGNEMLVIRRPV